MDSVDASPMSFGVTGMLRNTPGEPVDIGRKGSHGFLQKLFSRQPSASTLTEADLEERAIDDSAQLTYNNVNVMPCPYIRPLGNKLEPRIENTRLSRRRPRADSAVAVSNPPEEMLGMSKSYFLLEEEDDGTIKDSAAINITDFGSMRLQEVIAAAATADSSYVKDWNHYIKCYSEGRYNLIMPPCPPPRNPSFAYLPSTYPTNEVERLAKFQSSSMWSGTDIIWSASEVDRARSLIEAANSQFDAPWGAISFFDNDMEIVQAERGYSRHFIPRGESIASHVLLTNEVMTILDAQRDWRFMGNPLVIGSPGVRFFAGAPLLSANGEVIGVFAIFGPEPRTSFTVMQRRELTGYSEMAMQDLTALTGMSQIRGLRSIADQHAKSKDDASDSNTFFSNTCSRTEDNYSHTTTPAFRYHKASHLKPKNRLIIQNRSNSVPLSSSQYTPPSSDASNTELLFSAIQSDNISKSLENVSLSSKSTLQSDVLNTPESPTFGHLRNCSSRFDQNSLSGLDFLPVYHEGCPCTLASRMNNNSDLSPSEGDQSSITCSPIGVAGLAQAVQLQPNCDLTVHRNSGISASYIGENADYGSIPNTRQERNDRFTYNSSFTSMKLRGPGGIVDPTAEATFAAELWANNLDFDTIYAVELIPKKARASHFALVSAHNVETHILVSYGLNEPIEFDIPMHLKVLHSSGAMTWENSHGMPREYSRGLMMPLEVEFEMLENLSVGVVFGAFRKTSEDGRQTPKLKSIEIERLRQAAHVLKNILYKSKSSRRYLHGETEPPSSPAPKANAAREVVGTGKHLLDSGTERLARKRRPCRR